MTAGIAAATEQDVPAMASILVDADLPTEGLRDHLATALVARDGASVVATAAVELYGDAALLRSVAVARAARGHGLGGHIVQAALDRAHRRGAGSVYLLTTTAADFFARLGFRSVSRSAVPPAVRASAEFTRLCPESATVMTRVAAPTPAIVLFACVHNAGRSQMAAALFNALADPARARAISAGTQPAPRVHPEVVDVMREAGIEIHATPRRLTDELAARAQLFVTMGCGEACPFVPDLRRADWKIADPKGQPADRVRAIRDDVRTHVERLIAAEGWRTSGKGADDDDHGT
jgi:arsenate reductase (thioredoxin)